MIFVTQSEYEEIKKSVPDVRMTITSKEKKSKRKKRWIEEDPKVLKIIEELRK